MSIGAALGQYFVQSQFQKNSKDSLEFWTLLTPPLGTSVMLQKCYFLNLRVLANRACVELFIFIHHKGSTKSNNEIIIIPYTIATVEINSRQ